MERRGIAIGFGAIWIALLETAVGLVSSEHPPVDERIRSSLNRLDLNSDSIALQATAMIIKVLINSQGAARTVNTAREAFEDQLGELKTFMGKYPSA